MLMRCAQVLTTLVAIVTIAASAAAQNTQADRHTGPLVEGYGRHVDLPNPDFATRTGPYKVAVEILQALDDPSRPHPRFEQAARLVNMLAHAGVSKENLQVTLVLHGGGTRASLTDEAYKKRFNVDSNPSLPLLQALADAGVEIYLCEQSRVNAGVEAHEVAAPVKSALSAITTVLALQAEGYSFLTY